METLFYTGPSMNPSLHVQDVLHVMPYGRSPIRRGDVIVFDTPQTSGRVVHRVVHVRADGFVMTQGDNNEGRDPWVLAPREVVGRVTRAVRRGKVRSVRGGIVGRLVGEASQLRCAIRRRLFCFFRPVYLALSRRLVFKRLAAAMDIRVVSFRQCGSDAELHLLLGKRCIGRLLPGQEKWQIKPPFRLFVDEASLPRCQSAD